MKNTSYLSILGLTLRDIRENKKIKQKPIADTLSMTTTGLSKIEKGISAITAANLNKIAKAFDMSSSQILETVDKSIQELEKDGWTVSDDKIEEDDLIRGWSFASAATSTTSITGILAVPMIVRMLGFGAGPIIGGAVAAAIAGYSLYQSLNTEDSPKKPSNSE
jgi:transcriptional regulator with XRE-family HTH domain